MEVKNTYGYDPGGRLTQKTYSTGRLDSFEYDNNNNIVSASRAKDGNTITSGFAYDELNRMVTSTDDHSFTVGYVYDLLGRPISIIYPGYRIVTNEYDNLGRLTKQVDWSDREMLYAYDSVGRLISRTYPNGVVQKNIIDETGRMAGLSYEKTSGEPFLAYNYAYDRNGNLTDSDSVGQLAIQKPQAFDETFQHTAASKMVTKQDIADPNNSFTYTYDDNGNLVTAASPAKTYNLQYDEDNRTTTVQLQQEDVTTNIKNIYDVGGRRIARIKDGVETRFILDLTGRYEKAIAEADSQNNINKCFAYGADVLNYSIDTPDDILTAVIPDVNDLSEYEAKTKVLSSGFTVGEISKGWSDTVAVGIVMVYGQIAGSTVSVGTAVDLTVSLGKPTVPDVTGLTQAEAEAVIIAAGLSVGDISIVTDETVPVGNVISQDPISSTEQNVGTNINLVISGV